MPKVTQPVRREPEFESCHKGTPARKQGTCEPAGQTSLALQPSDPKGRHNGPSIWAGPLEVQELKVLPGRTRGWRGGRASASGRKPRAEWKGAGRHTVVTRCPPTSEGHQLEKGVALLCPVPYGVQTTVTKKLASHAPGGDGCLRAALQVDGKASGARESLLSLGGGDGACVNRALLRLWGLWRPRLRSHGGLSTERAEAHWQQGLGPGLNSPSRARWVTKRRRSPGSRHDKGCRGGEGALGEGRDFPGWSPALTTACPTPDPPAQAEVLILMYSRAVFIKAKHEAPAGCQALSWVRGLHAAGTAVLSDCG